MAFSLQTSPPPYLDDDTDPMNPDLLDPSQRYPGAVSAADMASLLNDAGDDPNNPPPFRVPPATKAALTSPVNDTSDPNFAVPQAKPGLNPSYSDAMAKLEAAIGERPQMTKPKWWQNALGAVAGFGAGWSNAASRTKNPIDIGALEQNILHPGYAQKLAMWQSRIEPLQQQAQIEAGKQQLETQERFREAQKDYYRQHGLYWAHRAQVEQNQWKLDPKTGTVYNTITGERQSPPPTPQKP